MSSKVRKNTSNPDSSLCHHDLVKMLVMDELLKRGINWTEFLWDLTLSHEHPP